MIKTVSAILLTSSLYFTSSASSAILLAGWDTFGNNTNTANDFYIGAQDPNVTADILASGITATLSDEGGAGTDDIIRDIRTNAASTDGSFGSMFAGMASTTAGQIRFGNSNATSASGDVFLNVSNTDGTGQTIEFANVLFDLRSQTTNGNITHNAYSVSFENITLGTAPILLDTPGSVPSDGSDTNVDVDASLATLADGEDGRFIITFSGSTNPNSSSFLDNIGISGEFVPVPEPSSLTFLALGGLAFARRRRA